MAKVFFDKGEPHSRLQNVKFSCTETMVLRSQQRPVMVPASRALAVTCFPFRPHLVSHPTPLWFSPEDLVERAAEVEIPENPRPLLWSERQGS